MARTLRRTTLKDLVTQITTMVWSVTQTQWSHPNLVEVIKFQQSFKMMLSKCCTQHVSKFGKPSSGHRTGKGQSSSQFPRRAVLKNVPTTGQLHSSPMLVRLCLKSSRLGFRITWPCRCSSWIQKRQRNQKSNCQHPLDHQKSKRVPEKYLLLLYWLCQSLCVDQNKLKNSSRDGNTKPPYMLPEKSVCRSGSNS